MVSGSQYPCDCPVRNSDASHDWCVQTNSYPGLGHNCNFICIFPRCQITSSSIGCRGGNSVFQLTVDVGDLPPRPTKYTTSYSNQFSRTHMPGVPGASVAKLKIQSSGHNMSTLENSQRFAIYHSLLFTIAYYSPYLTIYHTHFFFFYKK